MESCFLIQSPLKKTHAMNRLDHESTQSLARKIGVAWASMSHNICSFLLLEQIGSLEHLQIFDAWTLRVARWGQAARRCRSSPGMLPIGTNCIQLLELMSINLSMATTWQSDIRYHSESQWRSHIYIVAKHVVFFWFSFWEWEELNSEELLGAWWCHVHPSHFASKMFSWHPKMSHIARLDLIGSLDAYHVLCRSLSNLQSRWDMAEMFQGLLPFWMSSRLADEWISGFGWIGFLLASVNKGLIKWQERTQKCLLWYTNIYYKYWSFSRTYWCFYGASFSKDFLHQCRHWFQSSCAFRVPMGRPLRQQVLQADVARTFPNNEEFQERLKMWNISENHHWMWNKDVVIT